MEKYFTTKEQSMILQDLGIKGKTIMAWAYAGSKDEGTESRYAYRESLICVASGQTSGSEGGTRANYGHGIIAPAFLMAQLFDGFSSPMSRVFKTENFISPDKIGMEQVVDFLCDMLDSQERVEDFNVRMNAI